MFSTGRKHLYFACKNVVIINASIDIWLIFFYGDLWHQIMMANWTRVMQFWYIPACINVNVYGEMHMNTYFMSRCSKGTFITNFHMEGGGGGQRKCYSSSNH